MTREEVREFVYDLIEGTVDNHAILTTKRINRKTKNNESVTDDVTLLRAYLDLHSYLEQHKSDFINNFRKLGE